MFNLSSLGPTNPFEAYQRKAPDSSSNNQQNQTSKEASAPKPAEKPEKKIVSHNEYVDKYIRRHRRSDKGPSDQYTLPITTNQSIGWESSAPVPDWAKTPRYPKKLSEMTK